MFGNRRGLCRLALETGEGQGGKKGGELGGKGKVTDGKICEKEKDEAGNNAT